MTWKKARDCALVFGVTFGIGLIVGMTRKPELYVVPIIFMVIGIYRFAETEMK